jgi:hypothetical protein
MAWLLVFAGAKGFDIFGVLGENGGGFFVFQIMLAFLGV